MNKRWIAGVWAGMAAVGALAQSPTLAAMEVGRNIYLQGVRADGSPLRAERAHGLVTQGRDSACVQCHRPSGQGGAEGNLAVPPITGAALRQAGAAPQRQGRVSARMQRALPGAQTRPPYDLPSLTRALRDGRRPDGSPLEGWMPRYELDEGEIQSLWAYLDTLSNTAAPGHGGQTLHLAVIETEDVRPEVRAASTDVLNRCLAARSPPSSSSKTAPPAWRVHRWVLGHDPRSWPSELARLQDASPVFAIVSGIAGADGNGDWRPIHDHCERSGTPCLLPLTSTVDDQRPSHWSFYYSRGVSLEAAVAAQWLAEVTPEGLAHTWQQRVQPQLPAAAIGAERLREHLNQLGWSESEGASVPSALMLWMDAAHLAEYARTHPAPGGTHPVLVSGDLLGYDLSRLPTAWRRRVTLVHSADPLDRHLRRIVLNAGRWFKEEGIAIAADPHLLRLQGHSYTACEVARNALLRMGPRVDREYFLERVESAEEAALATAYPRFTLGPGQRHGAKGAWMVRNVQTSQGERLQPVSEWITPP